MSTRKYTTLRNIQEAIDWCNNNDCRTKIQKNQKVLIICSDYTYRVEGNYLEEIDGEEFLSWGKINEQNLLQFFPYRVKNRKVTRVRCTGQAHVIPWEQYCRESVCGYTPGTIYIEKKTGKKLPSQRKWNSARKCWQ